MSARSAEIDARNVSGTCTATTSVGESLVRSLLRDQVPTSSLQLPTTGVRAGARLTRGIGYLEPYLACGTFCSSTMPPRWMVLADINAYCCLGTSAAHRGLLELSMTPPAATAHYYAAAEHSPSCVTPTLNTTSQICRESEKADAS